MAHNICIQVSIKKTKYALQMGIYLIKKFYQDIFLCQFLYLTHP